MQLNIDQMFDKIQMISMMKTSISNNRISRLNRTYFNVLIQKILFKIKNTEKAEKDQNLVFRKKL